jgi:hypothetical protein
MPSGITQNDIKVALPFPHHLAPAQPIIAEAVQQHEWRLLSRPRAVMMNTNIIELQIASGSG